MKEMPKFASIKHVKSYGDDGEVSDLSLIHESTPAGDYKQYKVRHLVHNNQEQTLIYSKFVNDMTEKRLAGTLAILKDDKSTLPNFIIKYPKKDLDGSFEVFTCWTERA